MSDPKLKTTAPDLRDYSLNRAALRLLKMEGQAVPNGKFPLSEAILKDLLFWNGQLSHEVRIQQRLIRLGEAETPAQFAAALRPFLHPLAWDPEQAEIEGLPPYGPESLDHYTPTDLEDEAGQCITVVELLNTLACHEALTYKMTT